MLFVVQYDVNDSRTGLSRFVNWAPPAGFEFKAHYTRADDKGGFAIVETGTVALLLEATASFSDVMDFTVTPVMDIQEAVPIMQKAYEWADDVDDQVWGDDEEDDGD